MTAKKLYYSMGEVAEMFDVTPALIRHWEAQFDCIKPHRNKKGNRLFTPDDVERLKQIYHLVKERGMTLKGANKVLKRAKSDEVAQEMELLERLQKIRAALVEVREELKAGDGEQVVEESYPVQEQEVAAAADVAETPAEEPVAESIEEPAPEPAVEPVVESAEPKEESSAEQPKKRVVRRRKKSDEEDKELFPFYEQSLF
ncbi:MAG: MerR family transcriptional regulator [Alistipes sp.]|nr:MerR family transcriptional regulator [Alistipes sp.]